MTIEFDCSEISDNIRAFLRILNEENKRWAGSECHFLQAKMKKEKKWKNHSHEAVRRLHASYKIVNGVTELVLTHGVEYGVYLELAHKKGGEEFAPFAIIGPVVRSEAPKIMASYRKLMQNIMKELL